MTRLILISLLIVSIWSKELRKINLHTRTLSDHSIPTSKDQYFTNPNSCALFDTTVVQIDFEQTYNTETNSISNSSKQIYLAIALWSNETAFTNAPGAPFSENFVCDIVGCTKEDTIFQFNSLWSSPNTMVSRVHLNKTVSIAKRAWQLNTSALSFDFGSLHKLTSVSMYGWIGLGTDFDAHHNFQSKDPMFSLLLPKQRYRTGSLIFGFDSNIADIDRPLTVFNSDANWKMQMISLSFDSVVHFNAEQPLPLMFDLMTYGVIIPKTIRDNLFLQMRRHNLTCGKGSRADCLTYQVDNLPQLIFGLADGKNLSLSPNDYMRSLDYYDGDALYGTIFFQTNENTTTYYEDHIVLGWDILARFYTLFQKLDGVSTISFYEINSATPQDPVKLDNPANDPPNSSLVLIIAGVILVIVLLCVSIVIIIYFTKKNKSHIETETTELSKFEASSVSRDPQENNHLL